MYYVCVPSVSSALCLKKGFMYIDMDLPVSSCPIRAPTSTRYRPTGLPSMYVLGKINSLGTGLVQDLVESDRETGLAAASVRGQALWLPSQYQCSSTVTQQPGWITRTTQLGREGRRVPRTFLHTINLVIMPLTHTTLLRQTSTSRKRSFRHVCSYGEPLGEKAHSGSR